MHRYRGARGRPPGPRQRHHQASPTPSAGHFERPQRFNDSTYEHDHIASPVRHHQPRFRTHSTTERHPRSHTRTRSRSRSALDRSRHSGSSVRMRSSTPPHQLRENARKRNTNWDVPPSDVPRDMSPRTWKRLHPKIVEGEDRSSVSESGSTWDEQRARMTQEEEGEVHRAERGRSYQGRRKFEDDWQERKKYRNDRRNVDETDDWRGRESRRGGGRRNSRWGGRNAQEEDGQRRRHVEEADDWQQLAPAWTEEEVEDEVSWEEGSAHREVIVGHQGELTINTRNHQPEDWPEDQQEEVQYHSSDFHHLDAHSSHAAAPPIRHSRNYRQDRREETSNQTRKNYQQSHNYIQISQEETSNQGRDRQHTRHADDIPEFDPMSSTITTLDWIELMRNAKLANAWSDAHARNVAIAKLRNIPSAWIAENRTVPFNLVMRNLKKAYAQMTTYPRKVHDMIRRRKQSTETYAQYLADKMRLLQRCGIGGREAASCVIQGVDRWRRFNRLNVDGVETVARIFRDLDNGVEVVEEEGEEIQDPNDVRGGIGSSQMEARDRKEINRRNSETEPDSNNKIMKGFLGKKAVYKQYFKRVWVNGVAMRGYVDLGSENVTIKETVAVALKLRLARSASTLIRGFGGASLSPVGEAQVKVQVDDACADVTAYVIPDHTQIIGVVVGQTFTETPHVMIFKSCDCVQFTQKKSMA